MQPDGSEERCHGRAGEARDIGVGAQCLTGPYGASETGSGVIEGLNLYCVLVLHQRCLIPK